MATKLLAEGTGRESLEEALRALPVGVYKIVAVSEDGSKGYLIEIEKEPEGEGVGFPFLIVGGVIAGLLGTFFGWQMFKDIKETAQTLPQWAWYVGGAVLLVLLYNPIMNIIDPSRKYKQLAYPPSYYPPS